MDGRMGMFQQMCTNYMKPQTCAAKLYFCKTNKQMEERNFKWWCPHPLGMTAERRRSWCAVHKHFYWPNRLREFYFYPWNIHWTFYEADATKQIESARDDIWLFYFKQFLERENIAVGQLECNCKCCELTSVRDRDKIDWVWFNKMNKFAFRVFNCFEMHHLINFSIQIRICQWTKPCWMITACMWNKTKIDEMVEWVKWWNCLANLFSHLRRFRL